MACHHDVLAVADTFFVKPVWKLIILLVVALCVCAVVACAKPVPVEKSAYIGQWYGNSMTLSIHAEGRVEYERVKGDSTVRINGPIKAFEGNDIEVGVGALATRFVVSAPPRKLGRCWQMVVDGVPLIRSAGRRVQNGCNELNGDERNF